MSRDRLVFEAASSSSGHISDLERGRAVPNIATLQAFADTLGVLVADLVILPARSDREKLIDVTRNLSEEAVRKLLRDAEALLVEERSKSGR